MVGFSEPVRKGYSSGVKNEWSRHLEPLNIVIHELRDYDM
jgi:hypothetical protein